MFNYFSSTPMCTDLFTGLMPIGPQYLSVHFPTPAAEAAAKRPVETPAPAAKPVHEHANFEARPGLLDPLLRPVGGELEST
jgi:hypothetical protein